ncbi:hypothetical protein HYH03_000947 [Edaphochlamys debaryana]|uniref:Uncharacterized protein n=1 Tax=Edaphochlamys debaryana TaxID=47281 RepID=A0A836C6P3_9CHLO|nr:hypothetical protein HYH03_000947 [Edaphochlamys debaryana]|eukprot:KAG2501129.1 hypothetical protein HYH03_000947 [Edaphochlamys debaryana]
MAARWLMRTSMRRQEESDKDTVYLLNLLQEHKQELEARDSLLHESTLVVGRLQSELTQLRAQLQEAQQPGSGQSPGEPSDGAPRPVRVSTAGPTAAASTALAASTPAASGAGCSAPVVPALRPPPAAHSPLPTPGVGTAAVAASTSASGHGAEHSELLPVRGGGGSEARAGPESRGGADGHGGGPSSLRSPALPPAPSHGTCSTLQAAWARVRGSHDSAGGSFTVSSPTAATAASCGGAPAACCGCRCHAFASPTSGHASPGRLPVRQMPSSPAHVSRLALPMEGASPAAGPNTPPTKEPEVPGPQLLRRGPSLRTEEAAKPASAAAPEEPPRPALAARVAALEAETRELRSQLAVAQHDAASSLSNFLTAKTDLHILTGKYERVMAAKLEAEEQRDRLFSPGLDVQLVRAAMPAVDAALSGCERRLAEAEAQLAVARAGGLLPADGQACAVLAARVQELEGLLAASNAEALDAARSHKEQRAKWVARLEALQARVRELEALPGAEAVAGPGPKVAAVAAVAVAPRGPRGGRDSGGGSDCSSTEWGGFEASESGTNASTSPADTSGASSLAMSRAGSLPLGSVACGAGGSAGAAAGPGAGVGASRLSLSASVSGGERPAGTSGLSAALSCA